MSLVLEQKIGKVNFTIENYIIFENEEKSKINININFITQYATEEDIKFFQYAIKAGGGVI